MLVKKYANRRLYDTEASRYITLDELAERVRQGADPVVIDAADGADLTQATLVQIILESRGGGKLLPVALLVQLVRMQDDALAEFFGRWVHWALDAYVRGRQGMQWLQHVPGVAPWFPFGAGGAAGPGFGAPGGGYGAAGPGFGGLAAPGGYPGGPAGAPGYAGATGSAGFASPSTPSAGPPPPDRDDAIAALRHELDVLRAGMQGRRKRKPKV